MRKKWLSRVVLFSLLVVACTGCNPILLMSYLFDNSNPKTVAEFPLKPRPKHEKEEVRVVVLTSCAPGLSVDMIGIDRLLAAEFIPLLEARCLENKEKITILKSQPIDAYKKDNPEWRGQHPMEIGKFFKADYVIDIEVLSIDIYEPGTRRELMKGRSKIAVMAYDMSKPLKEPSYNPPESNFEYPRTHPVSRYDMPVSTFRQKFVKRIAEELAVPFAAHTTSQSVMVD